MLAKDIGSRLENGVLTCVTSHGPVFIFDPVIMQRYGTYCYNVFNFIFLIGPKFSISYFECPRLNYKDLIKTFYLFWNWTLCKFFHFCDVTADIREPIFASAYTYRCQTAGPNMRKQRWPYVRVFCFRRRKCQCLGVTCIWKYFENDIVVKNVDVTVILLYLLLSRYFQIKTKQTFSYINLFQICYVHKYYHHLWKAVTRLHFSLSWMCLFCNKAL